MRSAVWRSWLTAGLAALLLTAAAAGARAQARAPDPERAAIDDKEARDLFRLGKQAFDEGRFERALKYFKDAYDLSHRAALLSNIGTALDRLRRDQEALEAYRSYLAQVPDAPNRGLIEERVKIIEAAMNKHTAPAVAPVPVASPPSAAAPAPTPAAAARTTEPETRVNPEPAAPPAATGITARASADAKLSDSSPGLTSRWWFWAGIGAVAAGAVVVGVAASSGGGNAGVEKPAVLGAATRVREL